MEKIKGYLMFAGLMLAFPAAHAQNWYVGIGLGNTSTDLAEDEELVNEEVEFWNSISGVTASGSVDDSDTGLKVFGGYSFNDYLAVDFGYADLGEVGSEIRLVSDGSNFSFPSGSATSTATLGVSGLFGGVVGKLPLTDFLSLQGRAGLYLWDLEYDETNSGTGAYSGTTSFSDSDDGSDLYYGLGLNIGWFGLFYEVYDIDGDDVDFIGASANFNF